MSAILAMWEREQWGETPPEDLAAYARQRIGDRVAYLAELRDGWHTALLAHADEQVAVVRYTCWACDAQLTADQVCARCCGAEAIPGRCALPVGHEGGHLAPVPVRS